MESTNNPPDGSVPIRHVPTIGVLGKDADKIKLTYPNEPYVIGHKMVDGNLKPVYVDLKDLILTGDQKLEQKHNMVETDRQAALHAARQNLALRVECWVTFTLAKISPSSAQLNRESYESWLKSEDINFIEDQLDDTRYKFVLRKGDKIISEMTAKVEPTALQN